MLLSRSEYCFQFQVYFNCAEGRGHTCPLFSPSYRWSVGQKLVAVQINDARSWYTHVRLFTLLFSSRILERSSANSWMLLFSRMETFPFYILLGRLLNEDNKRFCAAHFCVGKGGGLTCKLAHVGGKERMDELHIYGKIFPVFSCWLIEFRYVIVL